MSKGSQRRKCLISREEESLRWDLALGKITIEKFHTCRQQLKAVKESLGICSNCINGLMIELNYKIRCRITNEIHGQWDTCTKFREDE